MTHMLTCAITALLDEKMQDFFGVLSEKYQIPMCDLKKLWNTKESSGTSQEPPQKKDKKLIENKVLEKDTTRLKLNVSIKKCFLFRTPANPDCDLRAPVIFCFEIKQECCNIPISYKNVKT